MRLTKIEKSMMNTYLLLTFSIAWGTELLLILLYRTPLSTGAFLQVLYYIGLGFGCGMEEVGWQGILQPLLQKRFPFLIAVLIEGAVWSIWHLPLWFIPASSQSTYSFAAFTLFCITLGATLAAAHRITKSIWVSVLLHAWSNTVLGGMYTLTSLCSFPNIRTLTISAIQILVVMGLAYLMKTKP